MYNNVASIMAAAAALCIACIGSARAAGEPQAAILSLDQLVAKVCGGAEDPKRRSCEATVRATDRLLNESFEAAVWMLHDPSALRAAQRDWLRTTRDACNDSECVSHAIDVRTYELDHLEPTDSPPRENPLTLQQARTACDVISRIGRDPRLRRRIPSLETADMTASERETVDAVRELAKPFDISIYALQLRQNKRVLFASVNHGGTCSSNDMRRVESLEDLKQLEEEMFAGDDNSMGWDEDLIYLRGRYFVLSGHRETKNVDWINPAGTRVPLCSLSETRREVLEAAQDLPLCEAAARGQLKSIPWGEEEVSWVLPSGQDPRSERLHGVDRLERVQVDIDNDGRSEWIARASWSSGGGCGSSGKFLLPLNADGSDLAKDSKAGWPPHLESNMNESVEVYEVGSARYIASANQDGAPVLYKLTPAGAEVACRFRDRAIYVTQ